MFMTNAVDGFLFAGGSLVTIFIGGNILRFACTLFNFLTGLRPPVITDKDEAIEVSPSDGIPRLALGEAVAIIFGTVVINSIFVFLVNKILGGPKLMTGGGLRQALPIAHLVAAPVNLVVMAFLLPTSFLKGLLVSILYVAICILLAAILFAIIFGIVLAFGGQFPNLGW